MRNFKKTMSVLLASIMAFSAFSALPITASAAEVDGKAETGAQQQVALVSATQEEVTDFDYEVLDDGTAEITYYNGTDSELVIPSEINGYKVTSIDDRAFLSKENLTTVIIPNTVTNIGEGAFHSCDKLTNVSIPESVNNIGESAFQYCISLTKINIPNSVTSIGHYAFSDCENLENIIIPESVKNIGSNAFENTIWFNNQPDGIIYINGIAYTYKGEMPENTSVVLKEGIKIIAENAFSQCTNLISVTLPDSVTSIGGNAFSDCPSLTNISIPSGVTSISEGTFRGCNSLESVKIPDSVTYIEEYAFYDCPNLKSITIPSSVKNIDENALGYYFYNETEYSDEKVEGFTIYGYSGTAAEDYANENGFEFVEIGSLSLGDLNGNGVVDINDATIIQKFGVGINTPEADSERFKCADVNGDGRISILDVTCVQKYIVGGYEDTGLLGK